MSKNNVTNRHKNPILQNSSATIVEANYSGPIPPASELEKINNINPELNFANRIILRFTMSQYIKSAILFLFIALISPNSIALNLIANPVDQLQQSFDNFANGNHSVAIDNVLLQTLLLKGYRNLQPTRQINRLRFNRRSHGLSVIDNRHIVLRSSFNQSYLITFNRRCFNLNFDPVIVSRDRYPLREGDFIYFIDRFDLQWNGFRHGYGQRPFGYRSLSRFNHFTDFCRIDRIHEVDRIPRSELQEIRKQHKSDNS